MSTVHPVPMWRLTDRMVRSGLVMAWRFATSPTRTSPDLAKPTTDGVVRPPSALGMTTGSPPSSTETTELVVPRSIPTALAMVSCLLLPALCGPGACAASWVGVLLDSCIARRFRVLHARPSPLVDRRAFHSTHNDSKLECLCNRFLERF